MRGNRAIYHPFSDRHTYLCNVGPETLQCELLAKLVHEVVSMRALSTRQRNTNRHFVDIFRIGEVFRSSKNWCSKIYVLVRATQYTRLLLKSIILHVLRRYKAMQYVVVENMLSRLWSTNSSSPTTTCLSATKMIFQMLVKWGRTIDDLLSLKTTIFQHDYRCLKDSDERFQSFILYRRYILRKKMSLIPSSTSVWPHQEQSGCWVGLFCTG